MTFTSENFRNRIVERVFRNFLDIMILQIVQFQPTYGYKIIKLVDTQYGIKLRHGALYPLLNTLEKKGYLRSKKQKINGRIRKVYHITSKAIQFINAYKEVLREQLKQQWLNLK